MRHDGRLQPLDAKVTGIRGPSTKIFPLNWTPLSEPSNSAKPNEILHRIKDRTRFTKCYLQAAAGDAGGAIGTQMRELPWLWICRASFCSWPSALIFLQI
jgi:hypothetical protein